MFLVTGSVGTLAMFIGSFIYAGFLGDSKVLPALLIMTPSVFFCCMMSVNRGYFQGLRNMTPTAMSQEMCIRDRPYSFTDMEIAAQRTEEAIENNEKIAVYGDYDADGVTATALLYTYLSSRGADVIYYIPTREGEGYGLHKESVDILKNQGVSLIITVDNGISAIEEAEYIQSVGIDIIITCLLYTSRCV